MKNLATIFIFIILSIYCNSYSQLVRDFRVNDDTTNTQQLRAMLGAADNGNFIILWTDRREGYYEAKDFFQRYNSLCKPIGRNVKLQTPKPPKSHAFTVRRDGSFVYAWTDTSKCYMRIFDSTGNQVGNTIIASDSNKFTRFLYSANEVSLSSDKNGNIIIGMTYSVLGKDTSYLYIQRFDRFGNKKDTNIRVNNFTGNNEPPDHSAITTRGDGSFIITWQGTIDFGFDIYMQMFDSSGHKLGQNRKVNDDNYLDNFQYKPSISSDSIGNFIIAWEDPRVTMGTMWSIYAQLYNPDGSLYGANFLVDSLNIGINDITAKVCKRRDGKYIIGWNFNPYANQFKKPQCQRFNQQNQKFGSMFYVPKTAPDTAKYLDDMILAGDKIITVWEDTRTGAYETSDIYCNILSFTNPDSTVGINKISNEVPQECKLYQNFPNPFNPFTTIKYQIIKNSNVKLIVYDILGKEIEILVNEKQSPGIYETQFNGINLSSGVYFYKLSIDGKILDAKKFILLK